MIHNGFKHLVRGIAFVALLAVFSAVKAQELPPGGDEGGDPDAIPLDGGISILLAAGAAYGAKKVYDFRRSPSE